MAEALDQAMASSRRALERGDYRQVLQQLEPLADQLPASLRQGGEVRLLMATAHQGLGQNERAISCSRAAGSCADPQLRRQAMALLAVLEAPELQVGADRLVQLPQLGSMPSLEGIAKGSAVRRRRRQPAPPPPPPVGRTRSPVGFALVALALLLGLTLLLGGCVRVDTAFDFRSPGRVRVLQQWQSPAVETSTVLGGPSSHLLLAPALEGWLQQQVQGAAQMLGEPLPEPELQWRERNWLVGVQQKLELQWDLTAVKAVPGLELHLHLRPFAERSVQQARPEVAQEGATGLDWQPQPAMTNRLVLRCWRWSALGLGAAAIAALLSLTVVLRAQLEGLKAPVGPGQWRD